MEDTDRGGYRSRRMVNAMEGNRPWRIPTVVDTDRGRIPTVEDTDRADVTNRWRIPTVVDTEHGGYRPWWIPNMEDTDRGGYRPWRILTMEGNRPCGGYRPWRATDRGGYRPWRATDRGGYRPWRATDRGGYRPVEGKQPTVVIPTVEDTDRGGQPTVEAHRLWRISIVEGNQPWWIPTVVDTERGGATERRGQPTVEGNRPWWIPTVVDTDCRVEVSAVLPETNCKNSSRLLQADYSTHRVVQDVILYSMAGSEQGVFYASH